MQTSRLPPRPAVAAADAIHERQAEQVADQIVRTSRPAPGRGLSLSPGDTSRRPLPPIVEDVLATPGQPLDPATRAFMEPRFRHDFGRVRVHTGAAAQEAARAVRAYAFTLGEHIVFADGRLVPGTADGRRLLAHELTHVVQHDARTATARPGSAVLARQPDPAPVTDFDALARSLARKLEAGKRSDVLHDLQALKPPDLVTLEASAVKVLTPREAESLRRAIHFVREPAPASQSVVSITPKTGVEVTKAGAKVGAGAVTVHTGLTVTAPGAGQSDSAYALSYKGSDAGEMRWLQFAWREVVPEYAVKGGTPRRVPARRKLEHSGQVYHLTTNPVTPRWNTDTGSSKSPFFEQNTTTNRTASELTMVDYPSPMDTLVGELFAGQTPPPSRVISHFHAATYLVHGMDVVYRADVDLTWEYLDAKHVTLKAAATGGPTRQLEAPHRTRLVIQFPDFAYLPGPVVGAPEHQPAFDIVRDVVPAGSLTEAEWSDPKRTDVERFADIAKLADVYNLIDAVSGTTPASINLAGKIPGGTLRPGLNYSSELRSRFPDAPAGETGYLDASGVYHNPDIPADRAGLLPRIVIILGPNAFTRGKAYALAVLRHEMTHALHSQLALGWLAKWRDEQPDQSFKDWLASQVKAKKLSGVDAAVIAAGTGGGTAATEVLAWTEGLVTALPFIAAVDVSLVRTDATYPAVVSALRGAGENFSKVKGSKELTQVALDRIRDVCCSVLTQGQRDLLVEWIDFLLDPSSRKPTESAAKLTVATFGPLKDFLTRVREIARKSCGKRTS